VQNVAFTSLQKGLNVASSPSWEYLEKNVDRGALLVLELLVLEVLLMLLVLEVLVLLMVQQVGGWLGRWRVVPGARRQTRTLLGK
jgi:hypothetical protein